MNAVYLTAAISSICVLSIMLISALRCRDPKRYAYLLPLAIVALPGSFLIYYLVRMPLDKFIANLLAADETIPMGYYLLFLLCFTALAEEMIKVLPAFIPGMRRKINADNYLWIGMIVGLSFGLGETWLLAGSLGSNPYYANVQWYQLNGFIIERIVSCLGHGIFSALVISGILERKVIKYLLYGIGLHMLTNMPVILLQGGVLNMPRSLFEPVLLVYMILLVAVSGYFVLFGNKNDEEDVRDQALELKAAD